MQSQLFADIPDDQRKQYLSDNCQRLEPVGYMKSFSPEELDQKRVRLADLDIDIDAIEAEKKDVNDNFAAELKPLRVEHKEILLGIKNKAEYVKEDCYVFYDEDARQVGFYNGRGQLVESRMMRPEEMQRGLFTVNRTGTND